MQGFKGDMVSIKLCGKNDHNGFMLSESLVLDGNIIVFTGPNGSGKTRLLESIQRNMSAIELAGKPIMTQEIVLVPQSGLTPDFGGAYNDSQYLAKITATLQMFDIVKNDIDASLYKYMERHRNCVIENALPCDVLYRLCASIAVDLRKSPSQVTHEEIKLYYEDYVHSVLGFQNISGICNNYLKRKKLNRYNRFRSEQEGEGVSFFSDEEFLSRFGGEPWVLLNDIVKAIFDDKFCFTEPDNWSESYLYNATLIQKDSGNSVAVQALSSGEKTLLWLALTLFNARYYNRGSVKAPKLLLLDEPDAFLHPKMVIKMYRALEVFTASFESRIIITTHSPTTVALAPEGSVYVVDENSVVAVTKDEGVAELLDGVTQISINPENRRQVFVESQYDADVYQAIYSMLLHRSELLDPKISLNFISSGPKVPSQQLIDKVRQILGVDDEPLLREFVESVNGVGTCSQVFGQVEVLDLNENKTVRGIVDWDLKNRPLRKVCVLAEEYAYSIENIALDPICTLLLLHTNRPEMFTMDAICGSSVHWDEWLSDDALLQESLDRFIGKVLGRDSKRDAKLEYVSGKSLLTDTDYLRMRGHHLEALVKQKYGALNAFARSGKDGELKYSIVRNSMINMTKGRFIPSVFEEVLCMVQREA